MSSPRSAAEAIRDAQRRVRAAQDQGDTKATSIAMRELAAIVEHTKVEHTKVNPRGR